MHSSLLHWQDPAVSAHLLASIFFIFSCTKFAGVKGHHASCSLSVQNHEICHIESATTPIGRFRIASRRDRFRLSIPTKSRRAFARIPPQSVSHKDSIYSTYTANIHISGEMKCDKSGVEGLTRFVFLYRFRARAVYHIKQLLLENIG